MCTGTSWSWEHFQRRGRNEVGGCTSGFPFQKGLSASHGLTIERVAVNSNESGREGGSIVASRLRATDV